MPRQLALAGAGSQGHGPGNTHGEHCGNAGRSGLANDDRTWTSPAGTPAWVTPPGWPTKGSPITATPQLDLTLVLPDGTRQPIALPVSAEAGRAAAKIALTLEIDGAALSGWTLVRDGSGAAIPAGVVLGDAGLLPDEPVRLVANPMGEPTAAYAAPPPPAYAAPPATAVYAAAAPPPPTWAAAPPAPARPSSGNATRYALVGGFAALVAVIAILGTLLATRGSDDVAVTPAPQVDLEPSGGSPSSDDLPVDPPPADAPSGSGGLGDTPLSQSGGVTSFSVALPGAWDAAQLDEQQDTASSTVTRSRTKLNAPTGGASIVVDALRGFDTPASENRAVLDNSYSATQPAYRRVAFLSVPVGETTGYEWRYELYDEDKSRMARRANVMFDLGGSSFAVMASGTTSTPFAELSQLARRVARTVQP